MNTNYPASFLKRLGALVAWVTITYRDHVTSPHSAKPEDLKMQDKVRSTHSLSDDSPLVSPEGLGCSDSSSWESIGKPGGLPLDSSLHRTDPALSKHLAPTRPSWVGYSASHVRPEDDILYQWRLRRKMELSAQQLQSVHQPSVPLSFLSSLPQQIGNNLITRDLSSTNNGTFTQAAPELHTQELPLPCTFPKPSMSPFQLKHHISPHTSHINTVPPCPLQSSPISFTKDSRQQQRQWRKSSTDPDTSTQLSTDQHGFANASDNQRHKPQSCFRQQRPPENKEGHSLISRKTGKGKKGVTSQGEGTAAEMGKKRSGTSSGREKGSRNVRHAGHAPRPDPALGRDKASRQRKESCKERRAASASPLSPLHNTLGMVVSEVLFPDLGSADTSRMSSITDSCEDTQTVSRQTITTPQYLKTPSEIITDLLREAEDSDELEFEDDPLLLVLREQRGWVKQRICEMHTLLEAWNERQAC